MEKCITVTKLCACPHPSVVSGGIKMDEGEEIDEEELHGFARHLGMDPDKEQVINDAV